MKKRFVLMSLLCVFCCLAAACGSEKPVRSPETAKYYYDGIEDLSQYIDLPDFSGLTLDVAPEPSDEEVESYISNARTQNKVMTKITDRPIAEGDTVAITFVGTIDGQKEDNCTYEDTENLYECTVGSGSHIPGFEEGLIGLTPGESVTLNLTFPDTFQNSEYAGKAVTFEVKTYEIRVYSLPELTDEFVKSLGVTDGDTPVETVDAYREYAKNAVKKSKTNTMMNNLDSYKWRLVADTAVIKEYPQDQIDVYISDNTEYYKKVAEQYGMEFTDYLSRFQMDEESFQNLMTENAKAYIRDCFVAEKIARDQSISFSEDEYKEMLEDLALDQSMESGDKLIETYGDEFMRMYFLTEKVVDYVSETVKEVNAPASDSSAE